MQTHFTGFFFHGKPLILFVSLRHIHTQKDFIVKEEHCQNIVGNVASVICITKFNYVIETQT